MSNDNIWYEIIVTDERGDRHRHLTDICPDRGDDDYLNGELIIDLSDTECITYMLSKIISWSYREIDIMEDVPSISEMAAEL